MERRTIIIISLVVTFLVGLPFLFFIKLAQGFGSSAGDYYKISNISVSLISHYSNADSSGVKEFTKINKVDTFTQVGLYIFFSTDYYSQNINSSSALMAAREPGLKGCKEKIKSISCIITDQKTNEEHEITSQLYMPNDIPTFLSNPDNSLFVNSKISLNNEYERNAMLFKTLEDFKRVFNLNSSNLTHFGLGYSPILFYLRKEAFANIDSSFKVTVKLILTDGSTMFGSTPASIK